MSATCSQSRISLILSEQSKGENNESRISKNIKVQDWLSFSVPKLENNSTRRGSPSKQKYLSLTRPGKCCLLNPEPEKVLSMTFPGQKGRRLWSTRPGDMNVDFFRSAKCILRSLKCLVWLSKSLPWVYFLISEMDTSNDLNLLSRYFRIFGCKFTCL